MEWKETRIPYGKGFEIYNKTPPLMQDILALFTRPIPRSVMLGSGFHDFYQELNKTQWYRQDKLKELQEGRLKALLNHAYHNVPYYHKLFKNRNIQPEDVRAIEDLEKLPILTKEDIRNHFHELIAVNAKDFKYGFCKTSGSTGTPLIFCLDQRCREIEYAAEWRQLSWAGIDFQDRIATFRGSLVYEHGKTEALWKFNALSKELDFNTFDLSESVLSKITRKLIGFDPRLIKGYPSVLERVSKFMFSHKLGFSAKAIQTSSESAFESQREAIEEGFHCKMYDWYGESEYVATAGQCPEGNYHINAESGIMEFVRNGVNVASGELGEILGTGFYNYSMPLIRYKVGDLGKYSDEKCVCGRELPLLQSLEGRVTDLIVTPDGKVVSGTSFEHYWKHRISPHTPNIDYVHIVQISKRKLLIEMVKKELFSDVEMQTILRELRILLGSEIEIEFRNLDSIPVVRKSRFTESEVDTSYF